MISISNISFLQTVFGDDWRDAHVTAFRQDPGDIPQSERAMCWAGGPASERVAGFTEGDNQYFTISTFYPGDDGKRKRRKNDFDACFVIVADDVNEKIPAENAERLPPPSYKLLTSAGSEQWGWLLEVAEENRDKVENLLDGLVAQGLAPDGKDPGMKGVTRYVRLPGGSNTKAKRYVEGEPFKCEMIEWEPERFYMIEALAAAFGIDLNAPRAKSDGKAVEHDSPVKELHPIWKHVKVTGQNGDWTQIDCPNVAKHTGDDASGAAVMIRENGSVAFQCHHGACNGDGGNKLTGPGVLKLLGIDETVQRYVDRVEAFYNKALQGNSGQSEQQKTDDQSQTAENHSDGDFNIDHYIWLRTEDIFYDTQNGDFLTEKALKNEHLATQPGTKGTPTAPVRFHKERNKDRCVVSGRGWYPTSINAPERDELIIEHGRKRLLNTWQGLKVEPVKGDASPWLDHVEYLLPEPEERREVLNYLAAVFQKVDEKPAFTILHRGSHGNGKDLMLVPIMRALEGSSGSATIDQLTKGWGDYMKQKKFLVIEEADKSQCKVVNNALKTTLAPTATGMKTLNMKGGAVVDQRDVLATYTMSNKSNPVSLEKGDRRWFVVDSWVEKKNVAYYQELEDWLLHEQGVEIVIGYLLERDLSEYSLKALPHKTKGYFELMDNGRYDYEIYIAELCAENRAPFNLGMFTLTTMKDELKKHDIKATVPSIKEAIKDCDYDECRGGKKVDGVTKATPVFFAPKALGLGSAGPTAQFEAWHKFLKGERINK